MKIILWNQKGGVGKSIYSIQIALYFDATIIELDPYGVLTKTLDKDRVYKVDLKDDAPTISEGDVVYDFGGFDDARLNKVSQDADLIIIPFNPTINALGTTLESYKRAKEQNIPILFIANAYIKEQDVTDAIEYIEEITGDEIEYFQVPHTRALQSAENEGTSIIDLATNSTGIKKHAYKKISNKMQELMNKIKEYI